MVMGAKSGDIHLKLDRLHGEAGRTGKLLMRGLGFAVVDDAGAVLLDQACAPQSISGAENGGNEEQTARRAFDVADALEADTHFQVFKDKFRVEITDQGKTQIQNLIDRDDSLRTGPTIRMDTIREALMARHLFFCDEHYILRDGRILLLDEQTGQPTANRQWSGGLQQLIEVKEGCEPSDRRVILARMSYQRFFQCYLRLGGLSDTAREAAAELWKTYRIPVVAIPAGQDMHRLRYADQVFATASERLQAIVERAVEISVQGRPVFIAAPTVEAASAITECLAGQGVAHNDLATAQPDEVAGIFADAGQPGVITVSANMAGVGVGIVPGPDSVRRGGLHVIIAEPHDSRRADRWLTQRCGRGGAEGSHELFLSLEDPMVTETGGFAVDLASRLLPLAPEVGRWVALYAIRSAQRKIERKYAQMRWDVLMYDRETSKLLAFSGRSE
jgi:preprotein translocase subunit SecA